jgi:ATP-binding cassette subfamily B (MDR/TAP) protein 1
MNLLIAKSLQTTSDLTKLLHLLKDTDKFKGICQPPVSGSITFKSVSFSYPEQEDVQALKNVNLESITITGGSGSGKSTIVSLLQHLHKPTSGSISIWSMELWTLNTTYLCQYVSVVSQNPNLFNTTITENITYSGKNLSEEDIRKAAKVTSMDNFIMSLPNGYSMMLGENTSLISGRQAQHLQIAQVLVPPSKILVLDECTSALDPANQAAVRKTIHMPSLDTVGILTGLLTEALFIPTVTITHIHTTHQTTFA